MKGKREYIDCAVLYKRHFFTEYSIFHCDSVKYDLMFHWITMENAISRVEMPHVRDCAISVLILPFYVIKRGRKKKDKPFGLKTKWQKKDRWEREQKNKESENKSKSCTQYLFCWNWKSTDQEFDIWKLEGMA